MREPYRSVEKSISKSSEIVDPPSNGEAITFRLGDGSGNYSDLLIEWLNNSDAWIVADNYVSLDERL